MVCDALLALEKGQRATADFIRLFEKQVDQELPELVGYLHNDYHQLPPIAAEGALDELEALHTHTAMSVDMGSDTPTGTVLVSPSPAIDVPLSSAIVSVLACTTSMSSA